MSIVIFKGRKSFWKTKSSVDLIIIEHPDFDLLEVATFDLVLRVESNRAYIDLSYARNVLKDELKGIDPSQEALALFIFNNLYIKKYLPTSKIVEIEIRLKLSSNEEGLNDKLMIPRPPMLRPHKNPFNQGDLSS